jgi:signal transduction histidine kinase
MDRLSPTSFHTLRLPRLKAGETNINIRTARDGGLLLTPLYGNEDFHVPVGQNDAVSAGNLLLGFSFSSASPALVPPPRAPALLIELGKQGLVPVRAKGSLSLQDYPWQRHEPNDRIFKPDFDIRLTPQDYERESFAQNIFARDPGARLWMAKNSGGLFSVEPGRFVPVAELADQGIAVVACDQQGRMWAGGTRGLFALSAGHWRQFIWNNAPVRDPVRAFYLDNDGGLWILGTSLARMDGGRLFSFADNVTFRDASSMIEDGDGAMWFAAPAGIFRVPAVEWMKAGRDPHYRVEFKRFDESDGLSSLPESSRFRCARTADGRIWFVLRDAVVSIDPHNIVQNRTAPPVYIENALADGRDIDPGHYNRLLSSLRSLRIGYTALSLAVPERANFKIKLEGFDKDWIDVGTRREATYTNLEPKPYRFRVIACNKDGVWNQAGASWEFRVLPAFYQTNWFLALLIAAGSAALWAFYQRRVHAATQIIRSLYEERIAERTRIARELHDTLLQSLAGASLQLDAISKTVEAAPGEARRSIVSVRNQMDVSFREARQKVWDLRSTAIEGRDLPSALKEYLEGMTCKTAGFRFAITGTHRPYPPHVEEQLLRIGQESVANVLRHADATSIIVHLQYEPNHLCLRVSDDGRGFDYNAALHRDGHWGLRNIRERAAEIGAECRITSRPGHGTVIQTLVPFDTFRGGE